MSFFSELLHEDGTPMTMEELFRMDEEFEKMLLKKYKPAEIKLFLYYLERKRDFRASYRLEDIFAETLHKCRAASLTAGDIGFVRPAFLCSGRRR